MSRRPSAFNWTDRCTTLTMNDGSVFRPSLRTGKMVHVASYRPVPGLNQTEPSYPVRAPSPLPPPPVPEASEPEVLEVEI